METNSIHLPLAGNESSNSHSAALNKDMMWVRCPPLHQSTNKHKHLLTMQMWTFGLDEGVRLGWEWKAIIKDRSFIFESTHLNSSLKRETSGFFGGFCSCQKKHKKRIQPKESPAWRCCSTGLHVWTHSVPLAAARLLGCQARALFPARGKKKRCILSCLYAVASCRLHFVWSHIKQIVLASFVLGLGECAAQGAQVMAGDDTFHTTLQTAD